MKIGILVLAGIVFMTGCDEATGKKGRLSLNSQPALIPSPITIDRKNQSASGELVAPPKENDRDILEAIKSGYRYSIGSIDTFSIRFSEDFSRSAPLRYPNPHARPRTTHTELEWLHSPSKTLYRWNHLSPQNSQGFLFSDGKTAWSLGKEGGYAFTIPVVTTETIQGFQGWNKTFDQADYKVSNYMKGPVSFLECLGTRLKLSADEHELTPWTSLFRLFKDDHILLGRQDVGGVSCWHVGFRTLGGPAGRQAQADPGRLWRVEAWFDPQSGYLPRKLIVRQTGSSLKYNAFLIYEITYIVNSFIFSKFYDHRVHFPEKWAKREYAAYAVSENKYPIFTETKNEASKTVFTILGNISIGNSVPDSLFVPPVPAGYPVIPKVEYRDWVEKNGYGQSKN